MEYRLAKARVAGSNPVSCSQRDRKKSHPMDGSFCMFKPCRARTVRMSTLRSGRRRRTSPGRSATSRALKEIEKRVIRWMALFVCSSPAGLERFECLRSAPVVAGERPPDVLRRLVLFFIRISSVDVLFL